jgi:hypothetical protein
MTAHEELEEVMTTEAELAESLVGNLLQQQDAIVHSRAEELASLVSKSDELLRPMESLEKERSRLAAVLFNGTAGRQTEINVDKLLARVGNGSTRLGSVIRRLRDASGEILKINSVNKPLLEHSRQFIRHTLRAATDDYKKNLIDKKM